MVYALVILLTFSIGYNFYVMLQVRKYRASLKYMKYEFERFAVDAEERVDRHQKLIAQTREELKECIWGKSTEVKNLLEAKEV